MVLPIRRFRKSILKVKKYLIKTPVSIIKLYSSVREVFILPLKNHGLMPQSIFRSMFQAHTM